MRNLFVSSLLLIGILSVPFYSHSEPMARPPSKVRVAVLDFKAEQGDVAAANVIAQMLLGDLVNDGRFTVVERKQVDIILKEQGFYQTGCTDDSCAIRMGKLLSAGKIVLGDISKLGGVLYITARVVDVSEGAAEHAEKCMIRDSDRIDVAISKLSVKLMDSMTGKAGRGFTIHTDTLITGKAPSGIMMEYNMFVPSNGETVDLYDRYQGGSAGYTYPYNTYLSAVGRISYLRSENENYSATMSFNSYQVWARAGFPVLGFMYPYIGISLKGTWIYEKGKKESAHFFGYGTDAAAGLAFFISDAFAVYGEFAYSFGRVTDEKDTDNSGKLFSTGVMYKL